MKISTFLRRAVTLCLFALLCNSQLHAQVTINPHQVVGFQFSSKDALNFDVIYPHKESLQVTFEVTVRDARGGSVVHFTSNVHILSQGVNAYNPGNFNIKNTRYVNKALGEIERISSFLPSGDYTYCITLLCADESSKCIRILKPELDLSACSDVHVEPISPLLLNTPENETTLKVKRPNFTWIPPMPIGNNPNLRYGFKLVKMLENQSRQDAIRRNRPLHQRDGINGLSLMFPTQLDDLEEGEQYAWQVIAYIDNVSVAESDVWEFEIERPNEGVTVNINQPNQGVHKCEQVLKFQYTERYIPGDLNYRILDQNNIVLSHETYQIPIERGLNVIELELDHFDLQKGKVYTIVVENAKGVEYKMDFQWISEKQ